MAWKVEYTTSARNQLRKLDKPTARRILDFMDERIAAEANPRSSGRALKGNLGGLWRYRVGDYRVLCEIQDAKLTVLALAIGHRREIYD